jgi:hypothetical protein
MTDRPPRRDRRATGVYYTPPTVVAHVLRHTLGELLRGKTPGEAAGLRVLDPACGNGAFLRGAYQYLLNWHHKWYVNDGPGRPWGKLCRSRDGSSRLSARERRRILLVHIHGVDIDPAAVAAARLSLTRMCCAGDALPDLAGNIKCGNALIGPDFPGGRSVNAFDWRAEYPIIRKAGGFDVVIGNPPWGQKGVADGEMVKRYLARRFPSSAGIYDWFRPFVERGVELTAPGGMFGMVLPDIILLKDYPATRRYLLDHLTLTHIDWWGMVFPPAVIDAVTIIGIKRPAPPGHRVSVHVRAEPPTRHRVPQADFAANRGHALNLYLTPAGRRALDRLACYPRLGDYFEIHEGVHSGNIRDELFVSEARDETCRPLLFGRDEIAPYRLRWGGRYIRLGALPRKRTPQRYANAGRPEWHERPKVLVRRTGDFVLAAVDQEGRYASNNFFVVFPKLTCSLTLDGLCALLNTRFMTWYFRMIEPRQGRVFAELKIKHLRAFPLPAGVNTPGGCRVLNGLGRRCRLASGARSARLDSRLDALVLECFGGAAADSAIMEWKRTRNGEFPRGKKSCGGRCSSRRSTGRPSRAPTSTTRGA